MLLTTDKELLDEHAFEVPCFACERMGLDVPAEWIVRCVRADRQGQRNYFVCDDCLTRWRRYGFGVSYETDASWERL